MKYANVFIKAIGYIMLFYSIYAICPDYSNIPRWVVIAAGCSWVFIALVLSIQEEKNSKALQDRIESLEQQLSTK